MESKLEGNLEGYGESVKNGGNNQKQFFSYSPTFSGEGFLSPKNL